MELILTQTVETLGQEGDIVTVKPGYARNYLIPKKIAVVADKTNLALREQNLASIEAKRERERQEAEQLSKRLGGINLVIKQRVGEENKLFGSVTTADIAEKLKENEIEIDRKQILLTEPIKTLGDFTVPIKVGFQTICDINLQVAPLESE